MTPRAFAEWREGDTARWTHEITAEDVDRFAALSGDTNPLHLDDGFGRQHAFRGRVVHGMLLGAYLSRVIGTQLPGTGALWLSQTIRFARPVYVGDTIEVVVRIAHKSESLRVLVLDTTVRNQVGEDVFSGEARVTMLEEARTVPWTEMVAVVTGGARGIGAAVARALGGQGARVVVNYHRRRDAADAVVEAIRGGGAEAVAVQADVSTDDGAAALADAALERFGRVDVVVHNATPTIATRPLLELTWDEMDCYWRTYVRGAFTLAQRVVPGMKERGFGRFVHLLSSYLDGVPPTGMAGYVTAKSALWGLTRAMAVELAPHGITVNALSPSPVMTDQWGDVPDSRRRALALRVPRRRLATPEDVARAVVFLAGEGGDFLVGANLPLSGGETMS